MAYTFISDDRSSGKRETRNVCKTTW